MLRVLCIVLVAAAAAQAQPRPPVVRSVRVGATNHTIGLSWPAAALPGAGSQVGWWPLAGGNCTTVDAGTNLSCTVTTPPVPVWLAVRYYLQGDGANAGFRYYSLWSPMAHYPGDTVIDVTGMVLETTTNARAPVWQFLGSSWSVTNPSEPVRLFRDTFPGARPDINRRTVYAP